MLEIKNNVNYDNNNGNKKGKFVKIISGVSLSVSLLFSPNVSAAFNNYNHGIAITELNKLYIAYKNGDESKRKSIEKLIELINNNGGSNHNVFNQVKQEIFGQINQPR